MTPQTELVIVAGQPTAEEIAALTVALALVRIAAHDAVREASLAVGAASAVRRPRARAARRVVLPGPEPASLPRVRRQHVAPVSAMLLSSEVTLRRNASAAGIPAVA